MKLSIFTTVTNPILRGDNLYPSLECYEELADEVVIVNGKLNAPLYGEKARDTTKNITYVWPRKFSWDFIGQQFQRGYEACTGDVVIHADLDFIFHEQDFNSIRQAAQEMLDNGEPARSFYKYQFIQPDRYNLKSRLVIMVNKRDYGDRIKFNSGGDLCQPSLDGNELSPDEVKESGIAFYNYEKLCKTKEQILDDVGRMDRAYNSYFGKYIYGEDGSDPSAYEGWLKMMVGRYGKPQKEIKLEEHPKYIIETIKNLNPNQWGYSGFGLTRRDKNV